MRTVLLCLILLSLATASDAQQPAKISGMKQLTDSIQAIMKQDGVTGLMLGIATKDSVLFTGGFGYADVDAKRKVDEHTLFRMGSLSKMMVSLGIMRLISEGKIDLNDELRKVAPEVPFQNDWEARSPLRIVHLLEHTSGFDDVKLNRMYSLDTAENTGSAMMLVHAPSFVCRWPPGERVAYSNPGYAVLGYLIEKLSGKPYDVYLKEVVLHPLRMLHSNFNLRSKRPGADVKEYVVKDGGPVLVPSVTLLSGPQGALWSNAGDMTRFLQFFLQRGGGLYPPETIAEMETAHSSLAARAGQKNGYGLGINNAFFIGAKHPFSGHEGITGTCFSSLKYSRTLGVGFVVASNCNYNNYRIEELIVSFLERNSPGKSLPTQALDAEAIAPFLGRYQFESPRVQLSAFVDKLQNAPRIFLRDGKLYFKPLMGEATELLQTAPLTFAWTGTNVPMVCFTKNRFGKQVMMLGGTYYEQTSNFWALAKRGGIVLALLVALSAVLLGAVSFVGAIAGKLTWQRLVPRVLPVMGVGMLAWAVLILFDAQQYTYKLSELHTLNLRTGIVFLGTSAFALVSILTLILSIRALRKPGKQWFKLYYVAIGLALCLLTAVLWQSGWVGLRTWAL